MADSAKDDGAVPNSNSEPSPSPGVTNGEEMPESLNSKVASSGEEVASPEDKPASPLEGASVEKVAPSGDRPLSPEESTLPVLNHVSSTGEGNETEGAKEKPPSPEAEACKEDQIDSLWKADSIEKLTSSILSKVLHDLNDRLVKLEDSDEESEEDDDEDSEEENEEEEAPVAVPDPPKREIQVWSQALVGCQPRVRVCNWEQFKNCFSPEDSYAAIDKLELSYSDDLDEEMEQEQMKRLPLDLTSEGREGFNTARTGNRQNHAGDDKDPDMVRMERVRIKSKFILEFLSKVTGETFLVDKPHTFLRPFKFLIHHHSKFEEEFRALEEQFLKNREGQAEVEKDVNTRAEEAGLPENVTAETLDESETPAARVEEVKEEGPTKDTPVNTELPAVSNGSTESKSEPGNNVPADGSPQAEEKRPSQGPPTLAEATITSVATLNGNKKAEEIQYEHIKCYMEFARQLVPSYRKFDQVDHTTAAKIRYEDLWSLFRPGELVFQFEAVKPDSDSEPTSVNADSHRAGSNQRRIGPRLWRIWYLGSEDIDWAVNNPLRPTDLRGATAKPPGKVWVEAYYLDFDGESFAAVTYGFEISRFEGEKDITKLEVYPVRFHKEHESILDQYRQRGERFQKLLINSHLAVEHDGWTLSSHPNGDAIEDSDENEERPMYTASDVIIDHREALQSHPWWQPSFLGSWVRKVAANTYPLDKKYDNFPTKFWSGPQRLPMQCHGVMTEIVVQFDNIQRIERWNLAQQDDFIVDPTVRPLEKHGAKKKLTAHDLALLPGRLFAYSLRDRNFINANIENLKDITVMSDPFNELKISNDYKKLIKATVLDHFTKKKIQREFGGLGVDSMEQDFIRRKGKGLTFLLHGPPGVGKTATAEAVAYANRKPLFAITCGDLGIEPSEVEYRLSEVFRLANLWDCVLLLDEADIFLSQRLKTDDNLQRNALVSIFLRSMEYYPGILFLTTNRPGALDEALSSRVHISIGFEDLNFDQTLALFRMNIGRSKKIAAERALVPGQPKLDIREDEIEGFARDQLYKSETRPWWNGRVIRNAFQIAMSLAYVDITNEASHAVTANADDTPPAQPTKHFGREQFESVLSIFDAFSTYRHSVFGKTDGELAEVREERYGGGGVPGPSHTSRDTGRGSRQATPSASRYGHSPRSNQPRPEQEQGYNLHTRDARPRREPEYGLNAYRNSQSRYDQDDGYRDPVPRDSLPRQRPDHGYSSPLHGQSGLDSPARHPHSIHHPHEHAISTGSPGKIAPPSIQPSIERPEFDDDQYRYP